MPLFYTILEKSILKTKEENEFSNESSFSFDRIKTYFEGYHEYISNGDVFYNERYINQLSEFLIVLDYLMLHFYDLASDLSNKLTNKEVVLCSSKDISNEIIQVNFILLLNSYYQNIFVVRKSLAFGFEAQSKSLFRSNIELMNLILLFVNDHGFCHDYCESITSKSENKTKWYKLTRPSKIKERLIAVNDDIVHDYITNKWIEEYTEHLSKHVHNNDSDFNLANAFDQSKNGFKISLDDNVSLNYKSVLKDLIDISMISYLTLLSSLKKAQNIDINNSFLKFRNQVLVNMYVELIGELYKWNGTPWQNSEIE